MYFVTCDCGTKIDVNLWQSGTSINCPRCANDVRIPNSITLKSQSGDPYPLLNPLQKIERARDLGEPPFHGVCHNCGSQRAQIVIPVALDVLTERHLSYDGGVSLSPSGVVFTAASGSEVWQSVSIPLLLYSECFAKFQQSRHKGQLTDIVSGIGCLFLLAMLVVVIWTFAEIVAFFFGIIWVIGAVCWMLSKRGGVSLPGFIRPWLRKIRWVPEVLEREEEYRVQVGRPQPIPAVSLGGTKV